MTINAIHNYNSTKLKYFFTATTVSSAVSTATIANFALFTEYSDPSRLQIQRVIRPYRMLPLLALTTLPVISIQLAKGTIGEACHEYSPEIAVTSGWMGSSIMLGTMALMDQSTYLKNRCWMKRMCFANRMGTLTAIGVASAFSSVRREKSL